MTYKCVERRVEKVNPDSLDECFCGAVTVGERGQVVIPAGARRKMSIQPGDKMFVMLHPTGNGLIMFKIDEVREMLSSLLEGLSQFEQESVEQPISEDENLH